MNASNFSKLAAAVALACSSAAHALPLSQFNEADTANQVTLRIAGSSAVEPTLDGLFELNAGTPVCQPNTLDIWTGKNQRLYFCTGTAASGFNGKRLAVFKDSAGGSGIGVGLLLSPTTKDANGNTLSLTFFDPVAGITGCTDSAVPANGVKAAYNLHHDCTVPSTTYSSPADVGVSDLEPAIFRAVFQNPLSDTQLNAIKAQAMTVVMTGEPVTLNIYHRLQRLEFPASNVCNPDNASYGANGDTEQCMPSLSRSQLQELYNGTLTTWCGITSSQTAGVNLCNVTGTTGPDAGALADQNVYIVSRVITSGTRATIESEVTAQRCTGAAIPLRNIANEGSTYVFEGAGGGDVDSQLTANNKAGKGSLGLLDLSTQNKPGTDEWRFIKVDSYAPTVLNAVKGNWTIFGEQSYNYLGTSINGYPALSGNKQTLADAIHQLIGQPDNISGIDTSSAQPFGISGVLGNALDNFANVAQPPFDATSGGVHDVTVHPVATSTRAATGIENTCLPPVTVGVDTQVQ